MTSARLKYTIWGVFFGLVFPIFGTLLELQVRDLPLSIESIIHVQLSDYHLWIIDTAPLFLGFLAWLAGYKSDSLMHSLHEVEQSNERYQKLFEQSTEGILLVEFDGTIIDINPTALELYGYEKKDIIGKKADVFIPEGKNEDYGNLFTVLKTKGEFHLETIRIKKDGTPFWAEIIIGVVEKKGRKVLLTCVRDITSRKELEEEKERQFIMQKEANKLLEKKVEERTGDLSKLNEELQEKNKDLTDSITYAKRLQKAILPKFEILKKHFPESFILYEAKDIVSGDFYWFHEVGDKIMVAVADCTGHGVPGAFMSILGVELLNRIVIEENVHEPDKVLGRMDKYLAKALKNDNDDDEIINDGMDIAICLIDKNRKEVHFAGAAALLMYHSKNRITRIKSSRFGIGGGLGNRNKNFFTEVIQYKEGDQMFMFTDGYVDQFGGSGRRKLMISGFKSILESIADLPVEMQYTKIGHAFENWKGDEMQIDDVTVMGIRLNAAEEEELVKNSFLALRQLKIKP